MIAPFVIVKTLKSNAIAARRIYKRLLHRDIVTLVSDIDSDKNVLLSYITRPFVIKPDDPGFYAHSNMWECLQIAKTWLKYGYNVDVIDWDNTSFLPNKEYSAFVDIHSNMERIAPLLTKDCKKILHITGAHWRFQNGAEMRRISDLKIRRDVLVKARRQVPPSLGIEHADCATILGNAFTQGTFTYAGKPLYPIPLSTTVQFPYYEKNFDKIQKNFLWLGSTGMIHKGLDRVLEAFCELPDYHLTICGPVHKEEDFEKAYFKELYQSPNIDTLGFVNINSGQFQDIITSTCSLIYPSCSEGQAGSVITCLHAGLIPIISFQSGVDVEDFGIALKECSVEEIVITLQEISSLPEERLTLMSKEAWEFARKNHTRDAFSKAYDQFVEHIVTHSRGR
jgi:glycosyltransferase involved in cell wall biosynthesis